MVRAWTGQAHNESRFDSEGVMHHSLGAAQQGTEQKHSKLVGGADFAANGERSRPALALKALDQRSSQLILGCIIFF